MSSPTARKTGSGSGPARRPRPRPVKPKQPSYALGCLLPMGLFAGFIVLALEAGRLNTTGATFAFLALGLVTLAATGIYVGVLLTRLSSRPHPARAWQVIAAAGLIPGLLVTGLVLVFVANSDDHQRCIDNQTMTVVPASDCAGADDSGVVPTGVYYQWYYGGTGTQIGDEVQGGSLTPPGEDGSGGGSGGSGGGGDDGGDDGGDSSGGDGGD